MSDIKSLCMNTYTIGIGGMTDGKDNNNTTCVIDKKMIWVSFVVRHIIQLNTKFAGQHMLHLTLSNHVESHD